jgi:hypothetical protein
MKPAVASLLPHIIFPSDEPHALGLVNAVVYDDREQDSLREQLLGLGYEVIDDAKHMQALAPMLAAQSCVQCDAFVSGERDSEKKHIHYCFIRCIPLS